MPRAGGNRDVGWQRLSVFLSRTFAVVAITLACGQDLFGQSSQSPAFNPVYGPAPDASRRKIVVTSTADTVNGDVSSWSALIANPGPDGISLREALTVAKLTAGPKEISFSPALKGAVIKPYTDTQKPLPYLTSSDLVLDGDIDHDGQPDVTLDGTLSQGGLASRPLLIWSDNNHVNGLQFQNFGSVSVSPDTNTTSQPKKASGNRFTNSRVYATQPTTDGILIGAVTSGLNDFTWENTTVAGNAVYGTNNSYGVHLILGLGPSRNQIIGTVIQDNVTFGLCGANVSAGDGNSTWNGDNVARKPGPVIYSDGNLIKDTVIRNNRISEGGYKSLEVQAACDGCSQNRISNLIISGNTITHSRLSTVGMVLACVGPQIGTARPSQNNTMENILIENNVIENHRYGIFISGSEAPLEKPPPPCGGQTGNRVRQITVRQNTVTNCANVGIEVWGGRGNSDPNAVQDNRIIGLDITGNILATNRPATIAGILLMGGVTLDEVSAQYTGPARQNSIESVTISGNRVSGGTASIKAIGGRGALADDNHVTGLLLSGNDVDFPPTITANDMGAVANTVEVLPPLSRLINLSTRGLIQAGGALTPGLVLRGTGTKQLIIRAVGPTLGAFGLNTCLVDPRLDIIAQGSSAPLLTNDDWGGSATFANACASVGAFALPAGSKDAAVQAGLAVNQSGYTIRVSPPDTSASGIVLAEVYDTDSLASPARLGNVSTLGFVGTGENALMPGFVISGTASKLLLIRAVGPSLSQFGVGNLLANPQLKVIPAGQSEPVASNDDWGGTAALKTAFTVAGAFSLPDASKDAAVFVNLPPGGYTVTVSGVGGTTGNALVEIYDLDP
jgi:hypothetical protein